MFLLTELWRLNRQQWLNPKSLEAITSMKLRRLVTRAWYFSPFYRENYERVGFRPEHLTGTFDLSKIPVITRTELMEAGTSAYCWDVDINRCTWFETSGSTGTPMRIPFTRDDRLHRILKELRIFMAHGYKFTDQTAILRLPSDTILKKPWLQRFRIIRRQYISILLEACRQIEAINNARPDVMYSYASNLRLVAEVLESGLYPKPKLKMLFSSAEILDEASRKVIAHGFGIDPTDLYGTTEFGWIGWQCPKRREYHLNSDCIIVECLRNEQPVEPGEEGNLVITNLHSDAAPLIRYDTGDVGVLSSDKCSCGRSLPLLSSFSGRLTDCIVLPGGRKLSPLAVTRALTDIPGMRQFQVTQEQKDRFKVHLMTGKNVPNATAITTAMCDLLNFPANIAVEYTEHLPIESNGKFRVVKSLVKQ
jgi:phenylacetate-CoA ligase